MKTLEIDNIIIALKPIPQGHRDSRSEREHLTVNSMITGLIGPNAAVDHLPSGAPFLTGTDPRPNISISHSLTQAAIAIGYYRHLGIDTETLRPQLERIKHKFLSTNELNRFTTPHRLLTAWCMKEAAYKAAGIAGLDMANDIQIIDHESIITPAGPLTCRVVEDTPLSVTVLCYAK